jgi:NDP-sugar pyrophosphorylase family protein
MRSMILAAGYGTRLRPITYTLPKPLVPVANRPLIAWAVDDYLRAGIDEIVVNLHHLPGAIVEYLMKAYPHCRFHFSDEREILGTGGALRRVRSLFEVQEEFFVVNGDTIQSAPFARLSDARRHLGAAAALTLRHPPANDRFTPVHFDRGRITGFGGGGGSGEPLMFAGSHCIGTAAFAHFPEKDVFGIVEEVYHSLAAAGSLAGVIDDGAWFDVGTPARYLAASRALVRGSLVAPTARVTGSCRDSVVGERSEVAGELIDSVVWDDCRIGSGVRLTSCIVAHGAEIRGPADLNGAVICRDDPAIPRDAPFEFADGLVIAMDRPAGAVTL